MWHCGGMIGLLVAGGGPAVAHAAGKAIPMTTGYAHRVGDPVGEEPVVSVTEGEVELWSVEPVNLGFPVSISPALRMSCEEQRRRSLVVPMLSQLEWDEACREVGGL